MTDSIRIEHDGVSLHALVDGPADAPTVVLLHGITSSVRTWEWLVPHMTPRYRTVRLDFRGHGKSDRTPGAYEMAGYVADAAAACRTSDAPCIVIGHSLGGATTAGLAQRHPELVRAAVLEDPPIGALRSLEGNSLKDAFTLMRQSVPQLQANNVPPDVLAGILGSAPSATGPTFAEFLHADALTAMAGGLLELDATVLDAVVEGRPMTPSFDPDAPITQPVLLLAADPTKPDCVARAADTEQFGRVTAHAQIVTMTGAGHLIHDELAHRDEFVRLLLAFLAGLD